MNTQNSPFVVPFRARNKITISLLVTTLAFGLGFVFPSPAEAQLSILRPMVFPVAGATSFGDDFGDPRSGGRTHEGNDIFGKKHQPLVAVVDGVLDSVIYPEATWGYSVTIRDKDGYEYVYIHMNNDNPGTDDGRGDGMNAYAPDIQRGLPVVKGQFIGYMGDSGNAEATSSHVHFEIRTPTGEALNPYESLKNAIRLVEPLPNYPKLPNEILPYDNFSGGQSIASGNFDVDAATEVVTGAGQGGAPLVRVFKKDAVPLGAFYAYEERFHGGIDVAAGDVDGDGKAEIITAPGAKGGPHIRVFRLDGSVVSEFFAYDSKFRGGVNVSAGDLDGDGKAEIVTSPASLGGPHIKVFSGAGVLQKEFMAYDPKFTAGVDVAIAAKTSTQLVGSVVTAPNKGGGPHIKVFDYTTLAVAKEFFAQDVNFNLGLRVSVGVVDTGGVQEIAVVPATGGGPHVKTFRLDGTEVRSKFLAFEEWWRGAYDITVSGGSMYIASNGGRRNSVRPANFINNEPDRSRDRFRDRRRQGD